MNNRQTERGREGERERSTSCPRRPERPVETLNRALGLSSDPFGLATAAIERGRPQDVDLKQALFAHYHIFIADIWSDFMQWRASQSEANLKLLHPEQSLRPIATGKALYVDQGRLPNLETLSSNLNPVTADYCSLVRDETEFPRKHAAALALIELSWKTFVYKWELEHRQSVRHTRSGAGVDLYEQCRNLLADESAQIARSLNETQSKSTARANPNIQKARQYSLNSYALTLTIGEAVKTAIEVWSLLPERLHQFIPQLAVTASRATPVIANQLLARVHRNPAEPNTDMLKKAINEILNGPGKKDIKANIQHNLALGNSSASPKIAGCPALGTPAFFGMKDIVLETLDFFNIPRPETLPRDFDAP